MSGDQQLLARALALRSARGAHIASGVRKLAALRTAHARERAALEREVLRRSARLQRAERAPRPDGPAAASALARFIDAEEVLEACVHAGEKLGQQREYCVSCLRFEEAGL